MSIGLIVPLIMALMMFDNLATASFPVRWDGFALSSFAVRGGGHSQSEKGRDPAVSQQRSSGDNITNHMLWNMMIGAPLVPFWRRRWVIWQRRRHC